MFTCVSKFDQSILQLAFLYLYYAEKATLIFGDDRIEELDIELLNDARISSGIGSIDARRTGIFGFRNDGCCSQSFHRKHSLLSEETVRGE